jgi:hypothetical protein
MRKKATETRTQLIEIMNRLHQSAQSQADFTAEKIAGLAGISTVWFYHLVRPEFQVLRSQLTGPRRTRDEELHQLRCKVADLSQQLKKAQIELHTTSVQDLDEAIILIERYEKENIQLRQQVAILKKRLEEGGQVIVQQTSSESIRSRLTLVNANDSLPT